MAKGTGKQKIRADLLLIAALLILAGAFLLWQRLVRRPGGEAVVYVNGVRTAAYPLDTDTEIRLETADGSSYNVLRIEDGTARVTDAGCPDKLCVHMHPIRWAGESITCLPNRTVIQIEGGASAGVDIG